MGPGLDGTVGGAEWDEGGSRGGVDSRGGDKGPVTGANTGCWPVSRAWDDPCPTKNSVPALGRVGMPPAALVSNNVLCRAAKPRWSPPRRPARPHDLPTNDNTPDYGSGTPGLGTAPGGTVMCA